jgi:nucleotide-binding universal stress UspA family protein
VVGDDVMTLPPSSGRITFRNILSATDFSRTSEAALAYAAALARHYGAKVYVVHVTRPELYIFGPPGALPRTLVEIDAEAEQKTRTLMSSLYLRDVPYELLLRLGDVVEVLTELSTEYKIDLLVVGTHGRRGLRKLLLGSLAEELIRLASCPVLTVGPRSALTLAALDLKRILYVTDFSEESLGALPLALSLGQEFRARTVLAHVAPEPGDDLDIRWSIVEAVTERLRALVPEEATLWSEREYRVDFGSPKEGILRAARDRNVDLIVMGARGIGVALHKSSPRGATAESVASCSTCPVMTVPSLGSAGTEEIGNATEEKRA